MKRFTDDLSKVLASAAIVFVVAFLLVPVFLAASMSFDNRTFLGQFPPTELSLRWYNEFFSSSYYMKGLRTSLLLAAQAALLSSLIGVPAAICLHRYRFPGNTALTALFLSPLMIPQVVIGFALLFFLTRLGLTTGYVRLLIAHVVITLPYTVRAALAGLAQVDDSLVKAALNAGANEWQAFWDVTFPLAKTGIVVGAIFAFAFSFDDVAVTLFLADPQNYTLPVAILSNMRASFDLTVAVAAVFLTMGTIMTAVVLDWLIGLDKVLGQGIYRG
jgi:putative spermidine/putrescine transport system permease protein